jgi:hypothetical protein
LLYTAFGLTLQSDLEIPGLAVASADTCTNPDVTFYLGVSPPGNDPSVVESLLFTSSFTDETGEPAFRIWKNECSLYRMAYSDGHEFWFNTSGTEIWAAWPSSSRLEDSFSYLLGPVFGLVLRYRGVTCLHASAAALGGSVAAFVGDAGAGKSTTVAALVSNGWTVLADDVVALLPRGESYWVPPAYPFLCLWPESAALIGRSADSLPQFTPSWDKRCLSLNSRGGEFGQEPLPLRAIYILAGTASPTKRFAIEPLTPREALIHLVSNTYGNRILDRDMRANEFDVLGRLLPKVPVRRLFARQEHTDFEQLCRFIGDDFRSVASNS